MLAKDGTWGHGVALAIVPKFTALLSLLGSTYIAYDVLRMPRSKHRAFHRILLGMSLCDCVASIAWFLGTWPIPHDVFPIYGSNGSHATCTVQGFAIQLSIVTVFYNGALAWYYFLVIRLGWSDHKVKRSRVEYAFHAVPLLFGFGTATAALSMGLFNPFGWECWISGVPLGCQESWFNDGVTTCLRGDNAKSWQWIFYFGPLWCTIVLVAVLMSLIVGYVVRREKISARWEFQSNSGGISSPHLTPSTTAGRSIGATISLDRSIVATASTSLRKSRSSRSHCQRNRVRETTWQACFYVGSFLLTWTFPTILIINEVTANANDGVYYHWLILGAFFTPAQGCLNFFTYMRPRIQKARTERRQRHRNRMATPQRELVVAARRNESCILNKAASLKRSEKSPGGVSFAPVDVAQHMIKEEAAAEEEVENTESTELEPM